MTRRGRRTRMPMLDSRRYWRIYTRKHAGEYPRDQASRFEASCRSNESTDAATWYASWGKA